MHESESGGCSCIEWKFEFALPARFMSSDGRGRLSRCAQPTNQPSGASCYTAQLRSALLAAVQFCLAAAAALLRTSQPIRMRRLLYFQFALRAAAHGRRCTHWGKLSVRRGMTRPLHVALRVDEQSRGSPFRRIQALATAAAH